MQAGHQRHRPGAVMGRKRLGVALGQRGDLAPAGQPPTPREVEHDHVQRIRCEQGPERNDTAQRLAATDRRAGLTTQVSQGLCVIHLGNRVFGPEDLVVLQSAADPSGRMGAPQAVQLAHDLDSVPDCSSDLAERFEPGVQIRQVDPLTA